MRKTLAAATLVAATFSGIAVGAGAASAEQPASATEAQQARGLPGAELLGQLPLVGSLTGGGLPGGDALKQVPGVGGLAGGPGNINPGGLGG